MASSVPSPFADRRAYPRVPVALPAFLQSGGERFAVQIVDLSAGGAKLDCAASAEIGTAVVLDCGGLARPAVVRWRHGPAVGICFETELDAREVSALTDRSKALARRIQTKA